MKKSVIFVENKPNRNGQIHILGTHETPKYMSQAHDTNLRPSDWLKSTKTAGEQLAHKHCSDFAKPSNNTPPCDHVSSNQIVYTVLSIYDYCKTGNFRATFIFALFA